MSSGVPSLADRLYARSVPHWRLGDLVRQADRERAPAARATRRHDLAIDEHLARCVQHGDAEGGLEDVGVAAHSPGVAERGAVRRAVDEDVRQLVVEVGTTDRAVQDDALAAEDGHGLPVDLEHDRLDGRELGERVDDLGEPIAHRGRAAARVELGGQVDRRDAVLDREAEQIGARRDRRGDRPAAGLLGRRSGQQGVHRRRRDGHGLRDFAQDGHQAHAPGLAAEHEVGADDHGLGRRRRRGGSRRCRCAGQGGWQRRRR